MKKFAPPDAPGPTSPGDGKSRINVGIEIGSSKVCVAVGERKPDGTLRILGVGRASSRGIRVGEIVDFNVARECVRKAVEDAEEKSDVMIASVRLAVTGVHISSFNHRSKIDISDIRGEIKEGDCRLVHENARDAAIPVRNAFLHAILQHYCIDGRENVLNPVGRSGHRLEAAFHIIHGTSGRIQSSKRCMEELGIEIEDVVFSPVATAQAVLTQTHKTEGVLLIDIGCGTTDYILYADGVVRQSGVLAVAGDFITQDICHGLRIPFALAEKLKIEQGSVLPGNDPTGKTIPIEAGPGFAGGTIERETLNTIIHVRVRETLELLKRRLAKEPHLNSPGAGIFLTGGTSLLKGIGPLTQEVFQMPVDLMYRQAAAGLEMAFYNPQHSTALGLL